MNQYIAGSSAVEEKERNGKIASTIEVLWSWEGRKGSK
jgi:hypothetical protein